MSPSTEAITRVALVTGANRGLGFETARQLASSGVKTIIGARNQDDGERAASALREEGFDAAAVRLDVRSTESAEAAAGDVGREHGRLDILINNAGILPEATAGQEDGPVSARVFRDTYETNVFGPVTVIEQFLPLLKASENARIVNVSSTVGSLTAQSDPSSPYFSLVVPAYQSSKAALNGVTVALAKALKESGIAVNSVCPGFVQTDLTPINREQAPLTAHEAARVVASVALSGSEALTGAFVDTNGPVAW